MKKINELLSKRTDLIEKMEGLNRNETLTDEQTREWEGYNTDVEKLTKEIERLQRMESLNRMAAEEAPAEQREDNAPISVRFMDWLHSAVDGNGNKTFELRADPILTTTNSAIINKQVMDGVDILTSPGESFLRTLGVTFFPGLTGNLVIPSMAEDTAAFVSEDASAASANMAPASLTLAARRITHTQSITRETLAQTNPGIYQAVLQNLVNGIWNAVANDVFDTLETDAATQIGAFGGGPVTYTDIVNMEASIGGLNIGPAAYVTTPTVKAFLKKTAYLTDEGAIWMDNEVNGYPAYGVPHANADKIYFGDWSRTAVGTWGNGIEVVVDPYSQAKQGRIVLTAIMLADTGCYNARAFAIMNDASVS
ncbi:MAG TPA: phage major capsid protein [Candidatus Paceibacterota bacterium]|nr:phage major capsid protein [Candidatus Paceibacterota bacterium]